MWVRIALMMLGVRRRAARRLLRNGLENDGKIVPKAKRNEQFRHHKQRSEQ
jgi:hypothetical protein